MGQLRITDMFSSQPPTPGSRHKDRAQLKITDMFSRQPRTPRGNRPASSLAQLRIQSEPRRAAQESMFLDSSSSCPEQLPHKSLSAESKPLMPRTGQLEVHIPARSSLSEQLATIPLFPGSIPSTPDGYLQSFPRKRQRDDEESEEETIPETPGPFPSTSTLDGSKATSQTRTVKPSRMTETPTSQITQPFPQSGNSPFDAIDVSSGVDTECEITLVRPSPKKKRKTQRPRQSVSDTLRAKTAQRGRLHNSLASSPDHMQGVDTDHTVSLDQLRPASSTPTHHTQSAASVGATASSSQAGHTRNRPAIKAKFLAQLEQYKPSNDHDCFMAKVQSSPQAPHSARSQKLSTRAKTATLTMNSSVSSHAATRRDEHREFEFKMQATPASSALAPTSTPILDDSNTDSEVSGKASTPCRRRAGQIRDRKIPDLKSLPGRRLFVKAEPMATPPPTNAPRQSEKSPLIDLTECSSSETSETDESSDDEQPAQTAQVASNAAHLERHSQQDDAAHRRDAEAWIIKREASRESSEVDIFYAAPELPLVGEGRSPVRFRVKREAMDAKLANFDYMASSPPTYSGPRDIYDFDAESSPPQLPLARRLASSPLVKMESSPKALGSSYSDEYKRQTSNGAADFSNSSSPISYYSSSSDEDGVERQASLNEQPLARSLTQATVDESLSSLSSDIDSDAEDACSQTGNIPPDVQLQNENAAEINHINVQQPYTLKPAYSNKDLAFLEDNGLLGGFAPHHRNTLIGLKGILKTPTSSGSSGTSQPRKRTLPPPTYHTYQTTRPRDMIRDWRTAGFPYLLFTKKKKSLDEIVEENLRREAALRRKQKREREGEGFAMGR